MSHLFVRNVLLSDSGMRDHPLTTMWDPDLRRVLSRQTGRAVTHVHFDQVDRGAEAISVAFRREQAAGKAIAIVDALTEEHSWAICIAAADLPLLTGGSGLAIGLAPAYRAAGLLSGEARSANKLEAPVGRAVILSGSCSVATREQVRTAIAAGIPALKVEPLAIVGARLTSDNVLDWLAAQPKDKPAMVYSTDDPASVGKVQAEIGRDQAGHTVEDFMASVASALPRPRLKSLETANRRCYRSRNFTKVDSDGMEPSRSFTHIVPEMRIHYGDDCLQHLRAALGRAQRSRAVVFCGRTLARDPGGLARVADCLGDCYVGSFQEVEPHSPADSAVRAASYLREQRADAVVALGGGSAIVTARGATILSGEGRPLAELCTVFEPGKEPQARKLRQPKLPQFVIPTTPTTACVKAGTALYDRAQGRRLTMLDPQTRAKVLFLDYGLARSVPTALFMDAALNTFSLAAQGLESDRREPLAEALLVHALRLLRDNLPSVGTTQDGAEIRGQILLAAVLAGRGTDHTGSGLTSVLGHCLGARHHIANGVITAILLPHVVRFNASATGLRLRTVVELFGGTSTGSDDVSAIAAEACAHFFRRLGLPSRLRDIGIDRNSFAEVIEEARTDWFFYQNPRRILDTGELRPLLEEAF